jgi:sulfatase modifying factor 1
MKKFLSPIVLVALFSPALATVTMDWVTVGNPGNLVDPVGSFSPSYVGFGQVNYEYKIGKYEVTNYQYGMFLNAVGKSDPYKLYNTNMSGYGINRSGIDGSYSYSVTETLANRPVVYVSWFDAARFANWLTNNQGEGNTENGSYTLNGLMRGGIIAANEGIQISLPTVDEWHKAAYYNPVTEKYTRRATGNNTITQAESNYGNAYGGSTDVGFFINSPSPYGTFDQAGNAIEMIDVMVSSGHGAFGGSWQDSWADASQGYHYLAWTTDVEFEAGGFRLAEGFRVGGATDASVPEPTSLLLTMLAGGVMLARRKR